MPGAFLPPQMRNHGNYIISLGNLCRWLGLLAEPAAEIAEADDVVAVVAHLRRQKRARHPDAALPGEVTELVRARRCVERRAFLLPVGDQLVERAGLEDGA